MTVKELADIFTELLDLNSFDDVSDNGLQVGDLNREVHKVAFAVDACQLSIDQAVKAGADMLFVHHGLFWGKPLMVTGSHYRRIKALTDNNLALYACHLPLDANRIYGNNACIASVLGLQNLERFANYRGNSIGYRGTLETPLSCKEITDKLGFGHNEHSVVLGFGKEKNTTVGICSGGAPFDVEQAIALGLDCYITGESSYSVLNQCLENPINMMCLGHYNTETFGVRAVMNYVKEELGLSVCFIDIPTDL